MTDNSLERTLREIAALSSPPSSQGEAYSRLRQINGLAREWLQCLAIAKRHNTEAKCNG